MSGLFQFFAVCTRYSVEHGDVTMHQLLTTVRVEPSTLPVGLVVHPTVGLILSPDMQGRCLVVAMNRLPNPLDRPIYAEVLTLPAKEGPCVIPGKMTLPIKEEGRYVLVLFDTDGAFGPAEKALASYCFDVVEIDGPRMPYGSGIN